MVIISLFVLYVDADALVFEDVDVEDEEEEEDDDDEDDEDVDEDNDESFVCAMEFGSFSQPFSFIKCMSSIMYLPSLYF